MLWKLRLSISVLSAITDPSRRPDGTMNRRLLSFLDFRAATNPNPVRGVRSVDLTVNPSRNLWIRVFSPSSAAAAAGDRRIPVIVLAGSFSPRSDPFRSESRSNPPQIRIPRRSFMFSDRFPVEGDHCYVKMPSQPPSQGAAAAAEAVGIFDELPKATIVAVSRPEASDITPMLLSNTIEFEYKQFGWLYYKQPLT